MQVRACAASAIAHPTDGLSKPYLVPWEDENLGEVGVDGSVPAYVFKDDLPSMSRIPSSPYDCAPGSGTNDGTVFGF